MNTPKLSRATLRRTTRQQPGRQRGAATLIVVMLLFFVVSLAAAYASRNLIFEQRTSANQLRSTQVLEAGESAIDWAVTMLNSGRIDTDCQPTVDATASSFRDRYLTINATTGTITTLPNRWAACSFDGNAWQCKCPGPGADVAAADVQQGKATFAVRFLRTTSPGVVRVEANGCSNNDLACLKYVDAAAFAGADCLSANCALVALFSGARGAPTAALTARQAVIGAGLQVFNQEPQLGSVTVHAGGVVDPGIVPVGPTGSPPLDSLRANDLSLSTLPADAADCLQCMFVSTFGVRSETFRRQMGALEVDCTAGCNAADVNAALGTARGRIVWLRGVGGLTLNNPADVIGTAASPVTLVVDGPLTLTAGAGAGARLQGLVYANSVSISGGVVIGALVSATTVNGNGGSVVYDRLTLERLRLTTGSFVRVPGSWRDFK